MNQRALFLSLGVAVAAAGIACESSPAPTGAPAGAAASAAVPAGPAPHIVFAETSFDFGNAASGAVLEHEFHFKNDGKGELVLQQPKGS